MNKLKSVKNEKLMNTFEFFILQNFSSQCELKIFFENKMCAMCKFFTRSRILKIFLKKNKKIEKNEKTQKCEK